MFDNKPNEIKAKRTAKGGRNPRYVTALNQAMERREYKDDLKGMFRHLTKKELKQQYGPAQVDALLAKANDNLKRLSGPASRPFWLGLQ